MFDGKVSGVTTPHPQSVQGYQTQEESKGDIQPPVPQLHQEEAQVHTSLQVQEERPHPNIPSQHGHRKQAQPPLGFLQCLYGDKQHSGEGALKEEGAEDETVTGEVSATCISNDPTTEGTQDRGAAGGAAAGVGAVGQSSRQRIQALKDRQLSVTMISTIRSVKIRELLDVPGYIYKRTSEWGLNFPEANGDAQSPINISSREAEYDGSLKDNPLSINYMLSRETDICNNGHTVVIVPRYKPGDAGFRSDALPKSTLRGGPLSVGQEYELAEFRFHWGRENERGSEHTVNFKAFPMELHLIHWNSSLYGCLEDALGKSEGVAIITLFIQIGRAHPGIKLLAEHLEDIQYKGRQKTITTAFNPNCLLPDPMLRDYWTYEGSLTSPPCSEKVTWIIFRYPLTVCNTQIEEFRRLRTHYKGEEPPDCEDGPLVDNFRATQPLNDRTVRASFQ